MSVLSTEDINLDNKFLQEIHHNEFLLEASLEGKTLLLLYYILSKRSLLIFKLFKKKSSAEYSQ